MAILELNMARLSYLIICEEVVVDKATTKISIVNIFNRMASQGLPATMSKCVIAFGFCPDETETASGEITMEIKVLNPKGKTILSATGKGKVSENVDPEDDAKELTSSLNIADKIKPEEYGFYKVQLIVGGSVIGERSFKIVAEKEVK